VAEAASRLDRTERLLALLLLQGLRQQPQREKIVQLNLAGFSNLEIADLLDTTTGVVAQELYASRKGFKKGQRSKRSKGRS
jgi:DNA-directed RNA polymerase specialized sigma24 family protein